MIGAAFGAFGQGLASGFLMQRRMAEAGGKGLMGLLQGGAGPKPIAPDALRSELSGMTQSLAPTPAAPTAAAVPQPNDMGRANEQPIGAPNAPTPQAAPAAPVASAPAATPTPDAAEVAQAPAARGVPVPAGKPGDGLVWSDRGPGDRLMMVRRDALRPGEQSFAVTEGTIGAGRGLPSVDAPAAPSAEAVAAAPVTPVTTEPLDPLPRGMGGPTSRPVVRGTSGGQIAGAAGNDTLVGGTTAPAPTRSSGRFSPSHESSSAYQWFVSNGYSPAAAAGIVGNLVNESGMRLDPRTVHDGGTGLGIAGWRDPKPGSGRRSALFSFAKERGLDPHDRVTQFRFLDHELRTSERGVGDRLRNAKDAREAASIFVDYERPAGWKRGNPTGAHGYKNRVDAALAHFGGQAEPGASSLASAGPAADGAAPREDGKDRVADATSPSNAAPGGQGAEGGREASAARMLPTMAVGVQTPEISNPIVGGGEPVKMEGARSVASRGLPTARPARKSNTWAALRAAMTKDAA